MRDAGYEPASNGAECGLGGWTGGSALKGSSKRLEDCEEWESAD